MRKFSIVLPSPFSDDYGKIKPYLETRYIEEAVFDKRGYCLKPAKRIKVVRRDLPSKKIRAILPR